MYYVFKPLADIIIYKNNMAALGHKYSTHKSVVTKLYSLL